MSAIPNAKNTAFHPDPGGMPVEMRDLARWVCWRIEKRQGKPTKVPYGASTGRRAAADDPRTWAPFDVAWNAYHRSAGRYDGVGFMLGPRSDTAIYCGVDLDKCRDPETGEIKPWARIIIDSLATYAEISPSGTGVKLIARITSRLDPKQTGSKRPWGEPGVGGALEIYDRARFFTVTGARLDADLATIQERQEEIAALYAKVKQPHRQVRKPSAPAPADLTASDADVIALGCAERGGKFARLWAGDTSGYGTPSEARAALVQKLRYYVREDAERIERLMRQSGLAVPKWDDMRGDQTFIAYDIQRILDNSAPPDTYYGERADVPEAEAGTPPTEDATAAAGLIPFTPRGASNGDSDIPPADDAGGEGAKESQQDVLLAIAAQAELFRTSVHTLHARVAVNGHHETWQIGERGGTFRQWLIHEFAILQGRGPNATALTQALDVIKARAQFDGAVCEVYTRLAHQDGKLYLDLANAAWQCVEIDAAGWRVIDNPPVYFRRPPTMLPLPTPVRGGVLADFRRFVNVASDDDWRLLAAWLLGTLHPSGPYPVLAIHGERGTAKSYATRLVRRLIDPRKPATQGKPKDDRDLAVAAQNGWVFALDNLSSMPAELSDYLCRLATGAGNTVRALYTDDGEAIFDARRPVVFNGIEELATRGDLLDRALVVTLPAIPDDKRRTEAEIDAEFAEAHPRILGALLDAASCALKRRGQVKLGTLPRMADFALWVTAAEPALGWAAGAFMDAYAGNRADAVNIELEAHPVSRAILALMRTHTEWMGLAAHLLAALAQASPDAAGEQKWPKAPNALSGAIRRVAPSLRMRGIDISDRRGESGKEYTIRRSDPDDHPPEGSSAEGKRSSADPQRSSAVGSAKPDSARTPDGPDASDDAFPLFSVAGNEQREEKRGEEGQRGRVTERPAERPSGPSGPSYAELQRRIWKWAEAHRFKPLLAGHATYGAAHAASGETAADAWNLVINGSAETLRAVLAAIDTQEHQTQAAYRGMPAANGIQENGMREAMK